MRVLYTRIILNVWFFYYPVSGCDVCPILNPFTFHSYTTLWSLTGSHNYSNAPRARKCLHTCSGVQYRTYLKVQVSKYSRWSLVSCPSCHSYRYSIGILSKWHDVEDFHLRTYHSIMRTNFTQSIFFRRVTTSGWILFTFHWFCEQPSISMSGQLFFKYFTLKFRKYILNFSF